MPKSIAILAVLAAALTSLVAGCGASDEATISKVDFIKQGDAICKRSDLTEFADSRLYGRKHLKNRNLSVAEATKELHVAVLFPAVLKEAEELKALGAPAGDEDEVEAIIVGIEKAVIKAEKSPESVDSAGGGPFAKVNKLASEYGFKDCAEVL